MTDSTAAEPIPAQDWNEHLRAVSRALLSGRLTPFLGAGVNLCGRDPLDDWQPLHQKLPSGGELARYLATTFDYPYPSQREDLVRVSQYIAIMDGPAPLRDTLHELFDSDYDPTVLHLFLAETPELMRNAGVSKRHPLIVTTNYDDALERAFVDRKEPFDLVSYMAAGSHEGRFVHWPPGEEGLVIDDPSTYLDVSPDERTVIVKIHGLVDRLTADHEWDSFVITEDHYIDYLTRTDLARLLPPKLIDRLKRSNFLFLGYSMRDWNLRAILQQIWQQQRGEGYRNWAVLLDPDDIDRESWEKRNVKVLEVQLDRYVERLREKLQERMTAPDL
jgi:hypothetical protein